MGVPAAGLALPIGPVAGLKEIGISWPEMVQHSWSGLFNPRRGIVVKITHAKLGQLGQHNSRRLVTICAELARPDEFMTITVTVLNSGSDREVCECGIARAKDFARYFAELPLQHFPAAVVRRP